MPDRETRTVEDRLIVTSGSLACPTFEGCDKLTGEKYAAYVRRHCVDHCLGEFETLEDAERNLGLWCFYYDHKYVFGNSTLCRQPFYEIHAFLALDEWNEDDLEERVPITLKTFKRIPDLVDRQPGDVRKMKQFEVPRQCEKTSTGVNAYAIFRSKHEYYVNGERNFPIMVRTETQQNARDSLGKIKAKSKAGKNLKRLYGVRILKCGKCGTAAHLSMTAEQKCPACGATAKLRSQTIAIIDPTRGAGGVGRDSVTFRWATNTAEVGQAVRAAETTLAAKTGDDDTPDFEEDDFEPEEEDEEAVYSIRAVGLGSKLTGQRPRYYILDDIQTEDNSKTHEMRMKLIARFDEARRQVKFGGSMLVIDTRKYVNDFAGTISVEPLRSLFHTLHRRAYWSTDEPDDAPYVISGTRYYYPIDGRGSATLDQAQLDDYWRQFGDRTFCTEFLNDPSAEKGATFKRTDFHIIDVDDPEQYQRIPIEIRYGLGAPITASEQEELGRLNLSIDAHNWWDPRGGDGPKIRGDDDFGVGTRLNRYGTAIFVTCMSAGQFNETEIWNEVERLNSYNQPRFNDYELGVDERSCKAAHKKWLRDRTEALGFPPIIPVHWSKMPKSGKTDRMKRMEVFTGHTARNDHTTNYDAGFFILSNAGGPNRNLIDKYVGQWIAIGRNVDHDDGPDATSRGISFFMNRTYQAPTAASEEEPVQTLTGGMSWATLKGMNPKPQGKTWGEIPL